MKVCPRCRRKRAIAGWPSTIIIPTRPFPPRCRWCLRDTPKAVARCRWQHRQMGGAMREVRSRRADHHRRFAATIGICARNDSADIIWKTAVGFLATESARRIGTVSCRLRRDLDEPVPRLLFRNGDRFHSAARRCAMARRAARCTSWNCSGIGSRTRPPRSACNRPRSTSPASPMATARCITPPICCAVWLRPAFRVVDEQEQDQPNEVR